MSARGVSLSGTPHPPHLEGGVMGIAAMLANSIANNSAGISKNMMFMTGNKLASISAMNFGVRCFNQGRDMVMAKDTGDRVRFLRPAKTF